MPGDHKRNLDGLASAPRCGAKTRKGVPCESPAVKGKSRCRMHGGKGSGAPLGNNNALRTGLHTQAMLSSTRRVNAILKTSRLILRRFPR